MIVIRELVTWDLCGAGADPATPLLAVAVGGRVGVEVCLACARTAGLAA
jgi:hypothetical protein